MPSVERLLLECPVRAPHLRGVFWSGSWCLGMDPDPGFNKRPYLNFFGMCKSHKYFRNLCCSTFWFMNIFFRAYVHKKKFQKKLGRKFINVRIRIRTFLKVGSGPKSSESATKQLRKFVTVNAGSKKLSTHTVFNELYRPGTNNACWFIVIYIW
jgi:hypothetical protein